MHPLLKKAAPVLRKALPILKLASKYVPLIPTPQDTWAQSITKMLAIADATNEVYNGSRTSRMRDLKERFGLVQNESETFVRLFFATTLRDMFSVNRETLDENEDLIEAVSTDGERLFFRESHYNGMRGDFYSTPGVDFVKIIDRLWTEYPNGIYLSITRDLGGWQKETTLCEVPPVPMERLSKSALARLKKVTEVHRSFMLDKTHRTYLAYGPAGTGKSSFAVLFAREFGGKALKIDATSLPVINVKEFGFLLDALKPNFLIIDDLDRAPTADVGARVLFLLERLKTHYPAMTVLLTVNEPDKLDEALLRCGRIDIPWEFTAPEANELNSMLQGLMKDHGVPVERATPEVLQHIQDSAGGLTHAYLDDLCRRLRHEEVKDVLASVLLLKKLADSTKAASKILDTKPTENPTPG